MTHPRLIFMGTPAFAATILAHLIDAPYEIVAVYSQPPRKAGRGHKLTKSPVHALADAHHIPVFTPTSLKGVEEQTHFANFNADLAIVAAYGLLLPRAILEAPHLGCLNIHASLLPRWRGASPIQQAILHGDSETGVTLMKMDEGLDTGPMIAKAKIPIGETTTTLQLTQQLETLGAHLLMDTLPGYLKGHIPYVPQPEQGVTHAPKITKDMGKISWQATANEIARLVCALTPWPGVAIRVTGHRVKILEAQPHDTDTTFPEDQLGTTMDDHLTIACHKGLLSPTLVQKEGGSPLTTDAFLRGHPVPRGTVIEPA